MFLLQFQRPPAEDILTNKTRKMDEAPHDPKQNIVN